MFDQLLNATFCPSPALRHSTIAFWSTPTSLARVVPPAPPTRDPSPRSTTGSAPAPDVLELLGPADVGTLTIPCWRIPVADLLEGDTIAALAAVLDHHVTGGDRRVDGSAVPEGTTANCTRSSVAVAAVIMAAIEMVRRGQLYPGISDSGFDEWCIGPLGPHERDLVERMAHAMPPESFMVAGGACDALSAVLGLMDCIADSLPRERSQGPVSGSRPWVDESPSDVSRHRQVLRSSTIARRTTLQLRLVLPEGPVRRNGSHARGVAEHGAALWLFVRSRSHGGGPVAASDLWSGTAPLGREVEHDLLYLLARAATVWPPLERLLDEAAPSRLALDDDETDELLLAFSEELIREGVEVLVPTDVVRRITAAPRVRITDSGSGGVPDGSTSTGLFTVDSLCEVSWTMLAGNRELDRAEIDRLLAARTGLVRLDDDWVLLDPATIERLRERRATDARTALGLALGGYGGPTLVPAPPEDAPPAYRPPAPRIDPGISAFVTSLLGAMTDDGFAAPSGLTGELRSYQRAGLSWSTRLFRSGFGGILADDMGLGKTIQMIGLHLWASGTGSPVATRKAPTLVVTPTGLLDNWDREFARWAPQVRVHRFHGPARSLEGVSRDDVVLTTYGVLREDVATINTREWGLVIADEAQAFKNPRSGTAAAMSAISSGVRFALTGTPVENHLGELWSLFDWTSPGLLGSLPRFTETIAKPIERYADPDAHRRLRTLTSPFMLRRTKSDEDIAAELPPRTVTDHRVRATPEQASLYLEATDRLMDDICGSTGMARRGSILALLTRLKEITNHPAHHLGQSGPLEGRSGKFDTLVDLVDEITASDQSVVVFTQYVRMGELLVSGLEARGHRTRMLHGGLGVRDRSALVDDFQSRRFRVLVVSLRAGGTGLNLTAATHVVHYDRWWNPAVENQASDRVWRIGQDRPVQIHRIITVGTVEERIAELIDGKQHLADSVMGTSAWFTELDDEGLAELVLLRDQPDGDRRTR